MAVITRKPLPAHLHAAYDWTDAAGEVDELRSLSGEALDTYAHDSAANCREGSSDVTASDLRELAEWLRANRPTAADNLPEITDDQIRALRTEAGQAGEAIQVEYCNDALAGDSDAREKCARVIRDAQAQACP